MAKAVIGGGEKKGGGQSQTVTSTPLDSKDSNGSVLSSSSSASSGSGSDGGIEVKAVMTIRKKIKEKITDKFEDKWEYFINGVGQGIQIQLISDQIDPGLLVL